MPTTMKVRYIGPKERKRDTINNEASSVVWNGFGDVQEMPYEQGLKLVTKHPDVWQDVAKHPEAPGRQLQQSPVKAPPARPMPLNEAGIAVIIEPDGEDPSQFEMVLGAMNDAIAEHGYVVTGMSVDGQNVAAVEIQSVTVDDDGNIIEILTHETIDALDDDRDQIEAWGKEHLGVDVDKRRTPTKLKAALKAVLDLREAHIEAGTQATKDEIKKAMSDAMKAK